MRRVDILGCYPEAISSSRRWEMEGIEPCSYYHNAPEHVPNRTGKRQDPWMHLNCAFCCLSLYGKYTHSRALFTAGRGLQLLRLETGQSRTRYIEYIFCTTCPSIPGWEPPESMYHQVYTYTACIHMTILDAAMQTPPRLRPSPGASAEKLRRHDCSCVRPTCCSPLGAATDWLLKRLSR
jgi:hypothetical protein